MASKVSSIPQKPAGLEAPLSLAQQRLWFIYQYDPQSPEYNISRAWRLNGPFDTQALTCSLNIILERHESLRTIFREIDGQPRQIVAPLSPLNLSEKDFSCYTSTQLEEEIDSFLSKDQLKPFNLIHSPPLRFTLLRCGPENHVLIFTIHHMVFDGKSLKIFCQELGQCYASTMAGLASPLLPLPIQYCDYASWQVSHYAGQKLTSQVAFWKQRLQGAPLVLELPSDYARPADMSGPRSYQNFTLSPHIHTKLKQLIQPLGMTLFMGLLTAFKILLSRYTGQMDILVGTPIEGRTHRDLEPLIGFLVNTLVLRTQVDGQSTFLEILSRVRKTCLEAYRQQDLPFEKLVEILKPVRDPSRYPIVQMLFQLRQASDLHLSFPEISIDPFPVKRRTANFDLHIVCDQNESGIQGFLYFSQELYSDSMMARFGKHFEILLEQLIANPRQPVSQVQFLPETETLQQLVDWNATQQTFPEEQCVHELLEEQTRHTPDSIAVVFGEQTVTYSQLNDQANALAKHLQDLGVCPDIRVGVCVDRAIDMLVAVLAVLKAGGAYVPLDPTYPPTRLNFMLENSEVAVLVTQRQFHDLFTKSTAHHVWIDEDLPLVMNAGTHSMPISVTPTNLAYVMYTSGSTGQPKGVAMPHHALVNLITWQAQQTTVPRDARTLQFTSLNFDVSAQEIFATLGTGGTLVLVSKAQRLEPVDLLKVLLITQVDRLFVPVVALHQLAEVAESWELWPTGIQEIITAGEALQITPVLRRFLERLPQCTLHNHYGPTETHVCTALTLEGPSLDWSARPPIGRPIANENVYVLDQMLRPVPIGVAGELYVGGVGLARGYVNRNDLTAEQFLPNPFGPARGTRLYKTGDVVRYRETGSLEFLGRTDHQVKLRGYRIELGEIEVALQAHPDVSATVVLYREDLPGEKYLVAYVVAGKEQLAPSELRVAIATQLPEYMLPSAFVILEKLPLTPNGKVNRRALPAPEADECTHGTSYVAPRTALEELLVEVWREVLKVERIGVNDNFFELGGHSLLATKVISRLRQTLELSVPLRTIFEHPTIAELAQAINTQLTNNISDWPTDDSPSQS